MAKVSTSISIDAEVKMKAQELFADFGLDLSTAINIFLRQSIRENGIPFIAAMREVEAMSQAPEKIKRYHSFSELLKEVEADA